MFRASSADLQEDTIVYMQHMVLSLFMRVPGGLSVHSLSEFSLKLCTDRPPGTVTLPYAACVQLYPPEDEHLRIITCRAAFLKLWSADHKWSSGSALVVLLD